MVIKGKQNIVSLLNYVPVIRFGFYSSSFLITWHLEAYSLKQSKREAGRHRHLVKSGHTHLISLKCTHTPCSRLNLVGTWRVAIWPALSSLIFKVCLTVWLVQLCLYVHDSLCLFGCVQYMPAYCMYICLHMFVKYAYEGNCWVYVF